MGGFLPGNPWSPAQPPIALGATGTVLTASGGIAQFLPATPQTVGGLTANTSGAAGANTAAINAAIQVANSQVVLPPGAFYVNPLLMNANGVSVKGAGPYATQLNFMPTGNVAAPGNNTVDPGTCFQACKAGGGSILFNASLEDLTINTTDSAFTKNAVRVVETSQFHLRNVLVTNFFGHDTCGLQTMGHELAVVESLYLQACVPLRISPSPTTYSGVNYSADHFVFRDLYLVAGNGANAPQTLPNACVLIDDGVFLSTLKFEGSQAWVQGKYGLYWAPTTNGGATSYQLNFKNIRKEQAAAPGSAYMFYIDASGGGGGFFPIQTLYFENCFGADGFVGWYLRQTQFSHMVNCQAPVTQAGGKVVDVNTCLGMQWTNMWLKSTDSANIAGMTVGSPVLNYTRAGYTLPTSALWASA